MRQKGRESGRKTGRGRIRVPVLLLLASLVGAGCGSRPDAVMLHLPPPDDWLASLEVLRARKDEYFKRNPQTPLPADRIAGFAINGTGLDFGCSRCRNVWICHGQPAP